MDEPEEDSGLLEHVQHCAVCRAEAALKRQVAEAVAAMPHVPAPDVLLGRVMDELRRATTERPARRRVVLALRPWEIGWISAAGVLLSVLIYAFVPWGVWSTAAPISGTWIAGMGRAGVSAPVDSWVQELMGAVSRTRLDLGAWSGVRSGWLAGGMAFIGGLFFLLSGHARAGEGGEWEEAHA
jgi:hypothetical protein